MGSSSTSRCFLLLLLQLYGVGGDLSLPHPPRHGTQALGRGSAGCGCSPRTPGAPVRLVLTGCRAGVPLTSLPRCSSGSEHPSWVQSPCLWGLQGLGSL